MLSFSYIDKETALEIVVHAPRQIAESIDNIQPILMDCPHKFLRQKKNKGNVIGKSI